MYQILNKYFHLKSTIMVKKLKSIKKSSLLTGLALSALVLSFSCNTGNNGSNELDVAAQTKENTAKVSGEYTADLTTAPNVPKVIDRTDPKKVIVNLTTIEKPLPIAPDVEYASAWTFNGTIPGPMIRVREGDLVEVHLSNDPSSKMAHNVDFHACTGPGGGAEASLTSPGKTSVFSFRALKPGLFIYHCAAPPVGNHIANGMYGMILVQPKTPLPPVNHEWYLLQSEFYTTGKNGDTGSVSFDLDKALAEDPDYVVFNGSTRALVNKNALQAKVGDKIRLYVGNAGPNLISSFHVIGEIMDNVHQEGGTLINHEVQTTLIPAGGSAIIEFTVEEPGTYSIVDHSIFRAFNKGALAQIKVTGDGNKDIYSGKIKETDYKPSGK